MKPSGQFPRRLVKMTYAWHVRQYYESKMDKKQLLLQTNRGNRWKRKRKIRMKRICA